MDGHARPWRPGCVLSGNSSLKTPVPQCSNVVSIPSIVAWKQKNIPGKSEKRSLKTVSLEILQGVPSSLDIPEFVILSHF